MSMEKYLPEPKTEIKTSGFSANEMTMRRLDMLQEHFQCNRSQVVVALINSKYDELTQAGEINEEAPSNA